jgi:primase-polymerase (primpol)-like protein
LGLALVIKRGGGLVFIDLDNALINSQLKPWAADIVALFDGAWMEISQSGNGIHIITAGVIDDHKCRLKLDDGAIEVYTHSRYVALTGFQAHGRVIPQQAAIDRLVAAYGLLRRDTVITGPSIDYSGPDDDTALVELACNAPGSYAAMFGQRAHFRDLWFGNVDELSLHFGADNRPDGLSYDASRADAALCAHLAFWTGRDSERMTRLWYASSLGKRGKVLFRSDYVLRTVNNAVTACATVYNKSFAHKLDSEIGADIMEPVTPEILSVGDMIRELVMIGVTGDVAHMSKGCVRQWDKMQRLYAASVHQYEDEAGTPKSCPSLQVWLKSPERKTVDTITWLPGALRMVNAPQSAAGNDQGFNTWQGMPRHVPVDDATRLAAPFYEHLDYLCPDVAERQRFIQWLAHIIQRPGELPHTCYLMVATSQGIGRNWLGGVLTRVLRGYVASGVNISSLLDNGFNGVLSQKLLAIVDEVREGMSDRKYQRAEAFKKIVTEEYRLINGKYERQIIEYNALRWLMFSNHLDALPLPKEDRRTIVIRNPDVPKSGDYYKRLYNLLHDHRFISAVYETLENTDISGFNAGEHAPMNSAKQSVIRTFVTEMEDLITEYRNEHTAPLSTIADLRKYLNKNMTDNFSSVQLSHAIRNCGIIKLDKLFKINGAPHPIIILRDYEASRFENATATEIKTLL